MAYAQKRVDLAGRIEYLIHIKIAYKINMPMRIIKV